MFRPRTNFPFTQFPPHRTAPRGAAVLFALGLVAALVLPQRAAAQEAPTATLTYVLERGRQLLELGDLKGAERESLRALERDQASQDAWALRAAWAERADARDELVFARHRQLALAIQQGADRAAVNTLRESLFAVDPLGRERLALRDLFVSQLAPIAADYEKSGRRHSAIMVHREILAIDPERSESTAAIERLASAPDPSLAEDARPKDLLEGVSAEWVADFDRQHATWATRARLQRPNYVTLTNAGYEVMVRAAEAMEQMNAFYRQFFQYGEDGGGVSPIELRIFRTREEYLKHGSSPAEWSGGQFTGSAVETYVGAGGFEAMTGTLFHEAAHQFVSLATNASGWLNEGLASFFEGCRLLANGTVQMNLPANHRLFPLATRMEQGWMKTYSEGIDPNNANAEPTTAPTFRIVLENRYQWGPPWYAPTWGVVYFLYNYQHPLDGRYVYRPAFIEFIDKSGGRMGEGAVSNFEEVVLNNPTSPTPGVDFPKTEAFPLPKTVEALDEVWRTWTLALRDEQSGRIQVERPWLDWARYALRRKEPTVAMEHFEKGLIASPADVDLLLEFADFLVGSQKQPDRAVKLYVRALQILERAETPDKKLIADVEKRLSKSDPNRRTLDEVHTSIHSAARTLVERYLAEGLHLMAMDMSLGLGTALSVPGMEELYRAAIEASGKTLSLWTLAYNERDLSGWASAGLEGWTPKGETLTARLGEYQPDVYDYRFLTLDTVTSGDFSMEAEVLAESGEVAFAGLVFGRKSADSFHGYLLFPPRRGREGAAETGYVDLTTFYGAGQFNVWRHTPVAAPKANAGTTAGGTWHRLRVDIVGDTVDVWFDNEYVASQTFQSVDVLRGGFGLITGPGESSFRNVRYLARAPQDFGAALERARRLEQLLASGESLGGSFLDRVPPWPDVKRWVAPKDGGEVPDSFGDLGLAPKLLVLWSIQQNDLMPLDRWLVDLEKRYRDVGLEIVAVASATDDAALEPYLEKHPFPGLVGVDGFSKDFGIGAVFGRYSIDRFNLPRLLLLGLDSKVVWEGDPGFAIGDRWAPGTPTFLDDPLETLVVASDLRKLIPWRARYEAEGRPALAAGRFLDVLALLQEAQGFDARRDSAVAEAQGRLAHVKTAAQAFETSAAALAERGASAALPTLLAWGAALGVAPDAKEARSKKAVLEPAEARAWEKAVADLRKLHGDATRRRAANPAPVAAALARVEAPFAAEAAAILEALGDSPSADELKVALDRVENLPGAWLAEDYLGW